MKVLRFIEACLICACFIPFTVLILLLLFPFSLIFEIVSIIHEIFTYDRYEHGWYVDTIKDSYDFIKDIYNKIMKNE